MSQMNNKDCKIVAPATGGTVDYRNDKDCWIEDYSIHKETDDYIVSNTFYTYKPDCKKDVEIVGSYDCSFFLIGLGILFLVFISLLSNKK